MPLAFASASVKPHQATSGSVKTTAGMVTSTNALSSPAMTSTAIRAFLGGLVREQDAAGNVANRVNRRVGRLLLLVDVDEALVIEGNLGVFQAEVLGIGRAADGDQHAVVKLLLLLAVASRTRL